MSLKKAQLTRLIAADVGFSQEKTTKIIKAFFNILAVTLAKGECISIRRFGKFYVNYKVARKMTHPLTGKKQKVGPTKIIKFKCFKLLHEEINLFGIEEFNRHNRIILQQLYDIIEKSEDLETDEDWSEPVQLHKLTKTNHLRFKISRIENLI